MRFFNLPAVGLPMSFDPSIQLRNLGKCYDVYAQPADRLRQMVMPYLNSRLGRRPRDYCERFWALEGVDLDVEPGETVGIVGRNGSGKSTLLQIVCGTLSATNGSVKTRGRIGALLELGSGFNPDFTGVENVFLNAAVLGLSRAETRDRLDDIADFAGIGSFIHQPVRTYSSGMMLRLAFAVQAQTQPDILIVDEALAVGDARFQAKCFERLRQLKEQGTSILLVTHSSEQIVMHCDRAVLMEGGHMLESGEPRHVVNCYLDLLFGSAAGADASTVPEAGGQLPADREDLFHTHPGANPHEYRWGDGSVRIIDFLLKSDSESYPKVVKSGDSLYLSFTVRIDQPMRGLICGVTVKTHEGITLCGSNTEKLGVTELDCAFEPGDVLCISFKLACRLASGTYFISLGVATRAGELVIPHDRRYDAIMVEVQATEEFFGLVDLDISADALEFGEQ